MYAVSEEYKAAVRALTRVDRLTGVLTLTDGTSYQLTDTDFVSGSVSISWQCATGEEIQYGTAMLGQLNARLITRVSRYALFGATVRLSYGVMLADGSWYDLPLGIYTVAEAERTTATVTLTCYDNMVKLDKAFELEGLQGNAYTMLEEICERCGLEMAQSSLELEAFPNTVETLNLTVDDSGCDTLRDCVAVIAQLLGAFAMVDRAGRLVIRTFADVPCEALCKADRYGGSSVADFVCHYNDLTITAGSHYYTATAGGTSGLTMAINDNPFFAGGTDERNQPMANALMERLSACSYVPAKVPMPGDPSYEPGDRLLLTGVDYAAAAEVETLVTSIDWRYHGKQTIESVGKNPLLIGMQTTTDKALNRIEQAAKKDGSTFYIYSAKNEKAVHVTTEELDVLELEFGTVDDTRIDFIFTSTHTLTLDGNVILRVYLDDVLYQVYADYEARGDRTLTFNFSLDVRGNARYYLRTTMQYVVVESDRRRDAADRATLWRYTNALVTALRAKPDKNRTWGEVLAGVPALETDVAYEVVAPDMTPGAIHVAEGCMIGTLFGRGLAATDVWDGTLNVTDYVPHITITPVPFTLANRLSETLENSIITPGTETMADTIGRIAFVAHFALTALPVDCMTEILDPTADTITLAGAGNAMADVMLERDIVAVTIRGDEDARYAVSNDSGVTWFNWADNRWHKVDDGDGQSADAMMAANADNWNALCVDRLRFRWVGVCNYIEIKLEGAK